MDGALCGWRVRSDLPLPELAPWAGEDRAPDIVVRLGAAPASLDGALQSGPFLQTDPKGACLLAQPNVATFHVPGPGEVVIDPWPGVTGVEIRTFLLGSVLGYLCHLRGLLPLHASCVSIDGKAVAFCGRSGAGKSTTALHLVRRGHGLLADDVCVVDTSAGPRVLPAFPRLKLWQDSLASADLSDAELEANRPGQKKFHYRSPAPFDPSPIPLAAIFLLAKPAHKSPEGITRLTNPLNILPALNDEVFRPRVAQHLGREPGLFLTQAAVAAAVPVYRLTRRFEFSRMDHWQDEIEALVRA